MKRIINIQMLVFIFMLSGVNAGEIVVIGNSSVPKIDLLTVQKIYTGKVISVSGQSIKPVNVKIGATERNRFLQEYMNQDEEKYTAYWTVRRYIGKGTPPNELSSATEIMDYVQSTPGAIGYVDEAEIKEGINVISRK